MGQAKGKKKKTNNSLWLVAGVAVVAVAGLIGLSVYFANNGKPPETTVPSVAVKTDAEVKGTRNQQGDPKAKVEIVEWGDYL